MNLLKITKKSICKYTQTTFDQHKSDFIEVFQAVYLRKTAILL
ncbi:hypothetical protein [Alysiella crassa]|nr:hypothetical protein [Alysiella crassa]